MLPEVAVSTIFVIFVPLSPEIFRRRDPSRFLNERAGVTLDATMGRAISAETFCVEVNSDESMFSVTVPVPVS